MAAGKLLRHWAIDAGLSIKELAARVGVNRTNLSKWLHGHARPHADQREIIQRMVASNPQPSCKSLPTSAWSEPETRAA